MALTIFTGLPTSPFTLAAKQPQNAADHPDNSKSAVTVTLSAQAGLSSQSAATQGADLVTLWRNALGDRQKKDESVLAQLQALTKQMHKSRHDDASLRLQQLLAQYHTLQMLGGSRKALADLAKQIKAAANELSASGDAADVGPSTDAAGANVASVPTDAAGATANAATAASAAFADGLDAGDAASGQPASDAAVPATAPTNEGVGAGASTSGDANPSIPSQGHQADAVWQQLIQQVDDAGARAQQKANDELLLAQARAAIGQIERMAKQAEEDKRHKAAVHPAGNAVPHAAPSPAAAAQARSSTRLDKVI